MDDSMKSWQCPGCLAWNAPWVNACFCEQYDEPSLEDYITPWVPWQPQAVPYHVEFR